MTFFTRLEERSRAVDSLLCIGLDPHFEDLPSHTPQAARDFCLRLIERTAPLAAAFKPNAAFFEAFGPEGVYILKEVISSVPGEIPVVLDAKRGDIASTARAYAQAAFKAFGASAVTVSPYLGRDSVMPFLDDPERGIFLLCKTSNPGAADLQDLPVAHPLGSTLYEVVVGLAREWNIHGNVGLVVGATQPDALHRVRTLAPELWILAPGVGAQGGDLEKALQAGLRADGSGLLLPVSRSIARSSDPYAAAQALRQAVNRQREQIRSPLSPPVMLSPALQPLADGLLEAGCVKFGSFKLKSGLQSPVYMDLRELAGFPRLLDLAAWAYQSILTTLDFTRLAALPYAALPIGTAVSLHGGWPMIYPRKEAKGYGTQAEIEGPYQAGERVVVIDDLATTGDSKFEAIEKLAAAGLQVEDVVVLIDRQSGAAQALASQGYRLHAVFTLTQLIGYWELTGRITNSQADEVREFLRH